MRPGKLFRFEAMWLRDPHCPEVVNEAWERGLSFSSGFPIQNCLQACRESLQHWNKVEFGHVGCRISALRTTLQRLELQPDQHSEEIRSVRKELNSWLDTEEVMWKQRSRNMYLVAGDRNTCFFHVKASNRNQKNLIEGMEDNSGLWQVTPEGIEGIVTGYFSLLFTISNPTEIEKVVETVQAVVSEPMNFLLGRDFQAIEVQQALKQMPPTKAPSPDGMPPLFYQKFWSPSGDCVTQAVLNFLNHGITPPDFNDTHIVLIPKVKNPHKITEYRPISLCNVIYKLASKTVANRLQTIFLALSVKTKALSRKVGS